MPGFDVETPNGDSSNGPRFSRDSSRNTRDLPSLLPPCFPVTLKFMDVCYQVKIENKQKKRNFGFLFLSFFYFLFCLVEFYPSWIFLLTYYYTFFPLFKRNIAFEINSWNTSTILAIARA